MLWEDKRAELKKAGNILNDLATAITSSDETLGNAIERYRQVSMMSAIANEIKRNPEYLSILEKEAEKNGIIDDKIQKEQVSALQILLSETLRRSNYKGSEIQMVLTDVTDPVGPYYTDTKTNTIVFDRKTLAKSDKVQLIKDLAHEFGHYSKADDNPKSQDVAIFSDNLIEK